MRCLRPGRYRVTGYCHFLSIPGRSWKFGTHNKLLLPIKHVDFRRFACKWRCCPLDGHI